MQPHEAYQIQQRTISAADRDDRAFPLRSNVGVVVSLFAATKSSSSWLLSDFKAGLNGRRLRKMGVRTSSPPRKLSGRQRGIEQIQSIHGAVDRIRARIKVIYSVEFEYRMVKGTIPSSPGGGTPWILLEFVLRQGACLTRLEVDASNVWRVCLPRELFTDLLHCLLH